MYPHHARYAFGDRLNGISGANLVSSRQHTAKHYAVFNQNPELAAFLRKLDSLKRILGTKTTLILDTEATPFDIFKIKVGSLEQDSAPKK